MTNSQTTQKTNSIQKFEAPKDICEALERSAALYVDIMGIESQLADPKRLGPDGKEMSAAEYRKWRHKANHAMGRMKAERVYLKTWIQVERIRTMREMAAQIAIGGMERALLNVINHITTQNAGMLVVQSEDQAIIDLARASFPDMVGVGATESIED